MNFMLIFCWAAGLCISITTSVISPYGSFHYRINAIDNGDRAQSEYLFSFSWTIEIRQINWVVQDSYKSMFIVLGNSDVIYGFHFLSKCNKMFINYCVCNSILSKLYCYLFKKYLLHSESYTMFIDCDHPQMPLWLLPSFCSLFFNDPWVF